MGAKMSSAAREAAEMERNPRPTRGEMGEFRADARRQRRILAEARAWKAAGFPAKGGPRVRKARVRGKVACTSPPGSTSPA